MKLNNYTIGLDIGIASCGWAVINNEKHRIEALGVRCFPAAENPKDKSALNLNRRTARGTRRRLRRRATRLEEVKKLFINSGLITKEELTTIFNGQKSELDVWQLRIDGLDKKLTNKELVKVLVNIAKRRGYKSNRKSDAENSKSDDGAILGNIKNNVFLMKEKGYRTYAELLVNDESFATIRNKFGEYTHCINRQDIEAEIDKIFEAQQKFGNEYATNELKEKYKEITLFQLSFMNPQLIEKMLGKCTFYPEEKRAPKDSYTFQKFRLLQQINNITLLIEDGKSRSLIPEEKKLIYNLAFEINDVTFKRIRKELKLNDNIKFVNVRYNSYNRKTDNENKKEEDPEAITKLTSLSGYHKLKSKFKKYGILESWETLKDNEDRINTISSIMLSNKTDDEAIKALNENGFSDEMSNAIKDVNYNGVGNLSIKAMKEIIPYLEEGLTYDKACEKAGLNFKAHNKNEQHVLPVVSFSEIRNPVVFRSITQTRKVVNAIISKYGEPMTINIELARDVGKSPEDRIQIEKSQKQNEIENEKINKELTETYNIQSPKPFDRLKYKLWKEQDGHCGYSMKYIKPEELFSNDNYVQVDHIIPFSRSADDGYNNKILVLADENQKKGNRTPFEYLASNEEYWNIYKEWILQTYKYNIRKRQKILNEKYTIADEDDRKARNLNDTRYMSRFLKNYIEDNLKFKDNGDIKRRVYVINGQTTAMLRNRWGLAKIRSDGDKHHAMDAAVIGVCTQSNIQKLCEYDKLLSLSPNMAKSEKIKNFELAMPWLRFNEELEFRLSDHPARWIKEAKLTNYEDVDLEKEIKPIFVSRMVDQKVRGKAHDESMYSQKFLNQDLEFVTKKVPLASITEANIKEVIQNPKFEKLYMSDKYTYDAILNRIQEFDGKSDKAFSSDNPMYKVNKAGEKGQVIKAIKMPTVVNNGVVLEGNKAFSPNNTMVRADVFEKDGKFYIIPIYVADMVKNELPNRAILQGKKYEEWTVIDDTYTFKFSLYPRSLIKVNADINKFKYVNKENEKIKEKVERNEEEVLVYYNGVHSGNAGITVLTHDNGKILEGLGSKTLKTFEKYTVDILGNIYKVTKEKRQTTITAMNKIKREKKKGKEQNEL